MAYEYLRNAASERPPIVTLTTDFGSADPYVGMMKGVILGIAPQVQIVDLTHEVEPQNTEQADFLLGGCLNYFPPGVIHLVVVDPGVGSDRRALAVAGERALYVAPDNGVLTRAMALDPPSRIVEVSAEAYRLPQISRTFHGRDIFGPAAAHLAMGVPIEQLGPSVNDPVRLDISPPVQHADGSATGRVRHIDRFGNCVTDIPGDWATSGCRWLLRVRGLAPTPLGMTYACAEPGHSVAVIGGTGFIEVAIRNGNAAGKMGIQIGDRVLLQPDHGLT